MTFSLFGIAVLLSGCVRQDVQGPETTYAYETWVCWAGVGAGVLMAIIGLALDKNVLLKLLLILGGATIVLLSPNLSHQSVTVGPEHFEVIGGSWWMSERKTIRYSDLSEIQRVTEKGGGVFNGMMEKRSYLCILKAGGSEKIVRDPLVDEAEDLILEHAAEKGALISGEWNDSDSSAGQAPS